MGGEAKDPRGGTSREARLAAALRDNLRRRKAQARGRIETGSAGTGPADAAEPARDTTKR